MDSDIIGEVNVVRVVLEELSSSEGDAEGSSDEEAEDALTEKRLGTVDDDNYNQHEKEEGVKHNVMEYVDKEHQVEGDEERYEKGDEERQLEADAERQLEADEERQLEGDEERQLEGDEERQIEGNEDHQLEGDEELQVEGDEELQVEGDEELQVEGDEEHQVEGNEEHLVEGDEELQVEGDEEHQVEGDEEHQVEGGEEHQVEGGEEHQVEEDEEHQVEGDEEHQVEGDEEHLVEGNEEHLVEGDKEHQVKGGEEFGVEGDEEDEIKGVTDDEEDEIKGVTDNEEDEIKGVTDDEGDGDFPMSSLKICYTRTLASRSDTSGTSNTVESSTSSILQNLELLSNQTQSNNEVELLKEIETKDATIKEQEMEINVLHGENMMLQKKLHGAMTCIRDLQKEINRFKKEMEEMEFLQDKNEMDKTEQPPKANSPEISCSQQSEITSPENRYSSSILVDRLSASELEPPVAKKAKKRVSFNLSTEDLLTIRRSERIFLSAGTSGPVDADEDVQTEVITPMPRKSENNTTVGKATTTNFHGFNTANTTGFFCTCGIQCSTKARLAIHVRKYSIGKKFQCTECNKKFYLGYLYRQHMKMTHGVTTLVGGLGCGFCGANFQTRGLLFKHQKIVHNISRGKGKRKLPKNPMKSAPAVMNTQAAIPIPVSKAPAAPLHQIDKARLSEGFFCICGYKSAHKFVLQTHVRYYNVERNFACPACNHKSVTLPDLKAHMKGVHRIEYDKRYGCRDCGSCFDTIKELFYHLAEVHDNGPLAKSNQKSKGKHLMVESTNTDSAAKKGVLKITEEDTVISAQAAQEALLSLKLSRETSGISQVVVMTPQVPQYVSESNQMEVEDPSIAIEVWNDEDELQLLEIQPEDEQLRLLEIDPEDEDDLTVDKELNVSTLEHGLMGMFGNDSWLCICGTKFQSERSLRSHMLLKSGMKPFKCQYCNEAFPRRDYLAYHHKRCHGDESKIISVKSFTCLDCGMQVKSRKKLRTHKAMMHPDGSVAASKQLGQSAYAGAMPTSRNRKRKYPQ